MKFENIKSVVEKALIPSFVVGGAFSIVLWLTNWENWKITIFDDVANPLAYFLFILVFLFLVFYLFPFSKMKFVKTVLIIPGLVIFEIALLSFFYVQRMIVLDEVSFPDGSEVRLVQDFALTDVVFSLWEKPEENWVVWQRMKLTPNYTEANVFASYPRIKLTNGHDRLLISRGGIWSDCFDLSLLQTCEGIESMLHSSEVELIRKNSEAIERLTGLKTQKF